MLVSFLILVAVLVVNKGKSTARSGKLPPVAKIESPDSPPPSTGRW